MKHTKEEKRKIIINLWNYFQPIHEHLGFEKNSTTQDICAYLDKKCKFNFNKWQQELFRSEITNKIFGFLMNPKSSFYIKGLVCENIARDRGQIGGSIGHYYIVKTSEEANRIKKINESRIKGRITQSDIRVIENKNFLQQLEYKENKKQIEKK